MDNTHPPLPATPRGSGWLEPVGDALRAFAPAPLKALLTKAPNHFLGLVVLGWAALLALPVLCVWALGLATWALEKVGAGAAAETLQHSVAGTIRDGYAIDRLIKDSSARTEAASARRIFDQIGQNNRSLDYVQFAEFRITSESVKKALPLSLAPGQLATIQVMRAYYEVAPRGVSTSPKCAHLRELGLNDEVLAITLDDLIPLRSLPNQKQAQGSARNQIFLNAQWWKVNQEKLATERPDHSAKLTEALVFAAAAPAAKAVEDGCALIHVEAVIEVNKLEPKS